MTNLQVTYWANQEAKRSNLAREKETNRNNRVVEAETMRHDLAMEGLSQQQLNEQNRTNVVNEGIKFNNLAELTRSNLASEAIRTEQNAISSRVADETAFHNRQMEGLQQQQIALGYANLSEQIRNNKVISAEQTRSAKARESIDSLVAATSAARAGTDSQRLNLDRTAFDWKKYSENFNNYIRYGQAVQNSINSALEGINRTQNYAGNLFDQLGGLP